jgi:hypothetical protein
VDGSFFPPSTREIIFRLSSPAYASSPQRSRLDSCTCCSSTASPRRIVAARPRFLAFVRMRRCLRDSAA